MLTRASTVAFLETRMTRRPQFLAASAFLILAALVVPAQAQWSSPVNITRLPPGRIVDLPSLVADSTGALHASWSLRVANDFHWIDYSTKPVDSDTWLTPVHVSRDSWPYCHSSVQVGPGGVPYVIWMADVAGHFYLSKKDGDTWTMPVRFSAYNGVGWGLRACADRWHRIHAVWNDADLHTIWYARYDDSGWHGPEAAVTDPGEMAYPDVAVDRDGYAHVVYQPPGTPIGCGYVRQTAAGWGAPETIPAIAHDASDPRIALDTGDCPQVAWYESRTTVYAGWTGAAWSPSVRLDSTQGYQPSICADSWGQVHVAFGDELPGLREAVCRRGAIMERMLVCATPGWAELAAGPTRLHALAAFVNPDRDVWYTWRGLSPPGGTDELPGCAQTVTHLAAAMPDGRLTVDLPERTWVRLQVRDVAGRQLRARVFDSLGPGRHVLDVTWPAATAGVYFCQVTTEVGTASVKISTTR